MMDKSNGKVGKREKYKRSMRMKDKKGRGREESYVQRV